MDSYQQNYLDVKELTVEFRTDFGKLKAVNRVSFSLGRGEVLGLVGESACGKSVTALSMLRLLPPGGKISHGEVCLEGVNLLTLSREKMRRLRGKKIAIIFQDPSSTLNPVRAIGPQFMETLKTHLSLSREKARHRSMDMLSAMGLAAPEGIMRKYPFQLSGGMRQRVMIAMALALEPDILIADEPTTALDVTVQAQILSEMRRLKKDFGTGIMLISHNMGVIAQLSDRVAVMYAGSIVEYGLVKEVFYRASHPYTRALLNSIPDLGQDNQELCSIKGQPPALHSMPEGCSFYPRCSRAEEICKSIYPLWMDINDGHKVACFFPLDEKTCCESHAEEVLI
ncbi:ABC transporter ATP-binding protein [Candidatus Contubernalis alkaliaceticus]|uniref:ABC transporter ATP-binding protein n=1 Tax=Candidatus Contubernalis alkaliaceticus TaxID=338645 RepID=UPI001F4C0D0B|nr:ABC transporter ATP-binding protein [Candidatus Contubernalis alkalaceticus]UNC93003.1 ABC transporter ATP-binding protein [Candidatus Contubernalis alkalaceticus]